MEKELDDYWLWVQSVWVNGRGEPLDFNEHKYLVDIYKDQFPNIVFQKAAQMGLSERLISEAVWICDRLRKVVLYTFPTSSQLSDFVQARLEPVFMYSDYLSRITGSLTSDEKKKRNIDEDDKIKKVGLKQIGHGFLYLRGSQNEQQIISVDADCVDDKTEILTNYGWKLFKDLKRNELVATLNLKTGYLEYQKPQKYISYKWKGDLISIENEQVNFAVKPQHNLYLKKQRKDFNFYKAEEIYGLTHLEFKKNCKWKGKKINKWIIPNIETVWEVKRPQYGINRKQKFNKIYKEKDINVKEFLEFLGFYITEGCVSKQHSSWYNVVRLGQNKGQVFNRIIFLLNKININYKIYPSYQGQKCHEIRIYDTQLAIYLANICGIGAKNKKIPREILDLDSPLLKPIFKSLMLGDGSKNGRYFCTTSKQLKNDFEELLFKIGLVGKTHIKKGNEFISNNNKLKYISRDQFIISINSKKLTPRINKKDWKKIVYDGKVYCVSVPNKTIYIRRNGSSLWIGNCIFLDERDRFIQEHVPYIDKRLLHSTLKWRREASTPTFPGMGISEAYNNSDQRVWMLTCDHCKLDQELDFFFNIDFEKKICICKQCKKAIDRLKKGKWVALSPDNTEIHGYRINGIYNVRRTVIELIDSYESAKTKGFSAMQQFYNQTLGVPFEAKGTSLLVSDLNDCKVNFELSKGSPSSYGGADVGQLIHVIISEKSGKKVRYLFIGTVKDFLGPSDSLESLIVKYNIKVLVVDAHPDTRKVRELIEKFPKIVYAAYYPTRKFDIQNYYLFDDVKREVYIDRTISIDYLVSEIQNKNFELPINAQYIPDFYEQMSSAIRVTQVNLRTGQAEARWIERGPDHYMHAANYNRISMAKGDVAQALLESYNKPNDGKNSQIPNDLWGISRWVRLKGERIF